MDAPVDGPKSKSFKIPLAINECGTFTAPHLASKDEAYRCPACSLEVILKAGLIKRPHFAHKATHGCGRETVMHLLGKRIVEDTLNDWLAGLRDSPAIIRNCARCEKQIKDGFQRDTIDAVRAEHRLATGHVGDVVCLKDQVPVLDIEILAWHEVDPDKAVKLNVPWVEFKAENLVEGFLSNCYDWVPTQHSLGVDDKCQSCTDELRELARANRERVMRIARETRIKLPSSPYQIKGWKCYRCDKEILVFKWDQPGLWDGSVPPRPRPPTIKRKTTRDAGEYWANTCRYCGEVQGDWFIHMDYDPYDTEANGDWICLSTEEIPVQKAKLVDRFLGYFSIRT